MLRCGSIHISLHIQALCIYQIAISIKVKGTVTGIEGLVALLYYEKSVTRKAQVSIDTGALYRTILEIYINSRNSGAETNLLRVGTTGGTGCLRSSSKGLAQRVLKIYTAGFKTSGVNIRNIVANNIHTGLMIF